MKNSNDSNKPQLDCDIAVVGAGVAGLGAAYFLSEDAHVIVLERESQPGYHSSGRSAALYIEGYENPVVAGLTAASGEFFHNPPVAAESPLLHDRGGLTIAAPDEEQMLAKYIERWQPFCDQLHPVDKARCIELCPVLRPEAILAGAYDPSYKGIDTHELMQTYQRGVKNAGGEILTNAEVTALQRKPTHWVVETTSHTIHAKRMVNAAGAWANELGQMAGLKSLDLQPLRRTALLIEAPDSVKAWPIVHTLSAKIYFKPESPGIMMSPQDETPSAPMDAYPEDIDVATALDTFTKLVDFPVNHVHHSWAGLRTFAPDRYPVVGADPAEPSFFWLAGQGGFGVQTSPGLGKITANAMLREEPIDKNIHRDRLG